MNSSPSFALVGVVEVRRPAPGPASRTAGSTERDGAGWPLAVAFIDYSSGAQPAAALLDDRCDRRGAATPRPGLAAITNLVSRRHGLPRPT